LHASALIKPNIIKPQQENWHSIAQGLMIVFKKSKEKSQSRSPSNSGICTLPSDELQTELKKVSELK